MNASTSTEKRENKLAIYIGLGTAIGVVICLMIVPFCYSFYRKNRKISTVKRNRRTVPLADLKDPAKEKERENLHMSLIGRVQTAEMGTAMQRPPKRHGLPKGPSSPEHKDEISLPKLTGKEATIQIEFAPTVTVYKLPHEDICRTDEQEELTEDHRVSLEK